MSGRGAFPIRSRRSPPAGCADGRGPARRPPNSPSRSPTSALARDLSFKHARPGLIRELIAARTDPVLFAVSYDYVGGLSETVALMGPRTTPLPARSGGEGGEIGPNNPPSPTLTEVVTTLRT